MERDDDVYLSVKYWMRIDDSMDVFAEHGIAGIIGLVFNGLFGSDAIIGLDFMDEFHIWSGQLLTPVDRTNFSGPFFISPWTYPGVMSVGPTTVVVTPNGEDVAGRDVGSVFWGDIQKGTFKYYLGVTHLTPVTESPLYSGRLAFAASVNDSIEWSLPVVLALLVCQACLYFQGLQQS